MVPLMPAAAVHRRVSATAVTRSVSCRVSPQARCRSTTATSRSEYKPVQRAQSCKPVQRARSEALSLDKLPCGSPWQTGLLIWFHGLGMSGKEFGEEFEKGIAQRAPWIQLHYPDAPLRAVSQFDGKHLPAWFDLRELPVSMDMDHSGLQEASMRVHAMIRQAEQLGIPASRIVLAGFSQGGALALQAGLTFDRPIAGIAAFSSWLPASLLKVAKHKKTPIFMGHGDEDSTVPFEVGLASYKALKDTGFGCIDFSEYRAFKHWFAGDEFDQLEAFATKEIPKVVALSSPKFPKANSVVPHPFKFKAERKLSTDSTDEGSSSDSPPTTDDERPRRLCSSATLGNLNPPPISAGQRASHLPMRTARSSSPQISSTRQRILESGPSYREKSYDASAAKKNFVPSCVSFGSPQRKAGQRRGRMDASSLSSYAQIEKCKQSSLSSFPPRSSVGSFMASPSHTSSVAGSPLGSFIGLPSRSSFGASSMKSFSCTVPVPILSHVCASSTTRSIGGSKRGNSGSFPTTPGVTSHSRLQRGCSRSQTCGVIAPTAVLGHCQARPSLKLLSC